MQSIIQKIGKRLRLISLFAMFAAVAIATPQQAMAFTGAGATVLNVVTVNYADASGANTFAETSSTTVTVSLVVQVPTLSAPANILGVASGSPATYTYTITSNANGSDVYDITPSNGAATNATITNLTAASQITLGASYISAVPSETTIEIPAGSEANILTGDILVVGGVDFAVSAITPGTAASHTNTANDGLTGTTSVETPTLITLIANAAGSNVAPLLITNAVAVGSIAAEQASFTVAVTATVDTGTGTVPTTVDVDSNSAPTGVPASHTTSTTFEGATISILKEVSTDGTLFSPTASGVPGSTLTYRITVQNTGIANATAVVVTDPMPLYTTYTAGTAKLDTALLVSYAAAVTTLTDPVDSPTDEYDFTANIATLTIGTLAGGTNVVLYYQVTID